MKICELLFDKPHPRKPNYSLVEIDYYAWVPVDSEIGNHRLSLRKNLKTGQFEVYRCFYNQVPASGLGSLDLTSRDTRVEQVIFSGTFQDALDYAYAEVQKYHSIREKDLPCTHEGRGQDMYCPRRFGYERT